MNPPAIALSGVSGFSRDGEDNRQYTMYSMHNEYILMKMGKKRKQENSKQVQNLAL
jgi:hypothetical protein